jgi:CelD/BcsL family acetyltransferase involved in cellulose biosynthesis
MTDAYSDNTALRAVEPLSVNVKIIDSELGLEALSEVWSRLARSISGCLLTQTPDWCRLTWQHYGKRPTDRLKILTAWEGERLIAVWPFRQRQEGMTRRLDILGCGIGDIADPLIDPAFDTVALCEEMLAVLRRQTDMIELSCLDAESTMARVIRTTACIKYAIPFADYTVEPGQWQSWDAFLGHYSQKMREGLRRRRRNLRNSGDVSFESVMDPEGQAEAVDWLLEQKQEWCRRNFFHRDWFYLPASRDFLLACLTIKCATGHAEVFALKRDGRITACGFNLIDRTRVGGLLIAHDPDLLPFAPGMLLVEDTLRFGYDRGLVVEMGIGKTEFKERWSTKIGLRVTYILAPTLRGGVALLPGYIGYAFAEFRREHLGPRLKAILPKAKIDQIKAFLVRLKGVPKPS